MRDPLELTTYLNSKYMIRTHEDALNYGTDIMETIDNGIDRIEYSIEVHPAQFQAAKEYAYPNFKESKMPFLKFKGVKQMAKALNVLADKSIQIVNVKGL
jgi:hypothetical protein